MSKVKLKHASGNSMSIAAPATNPASDLELKLPATIGTANQYLKNGSTPGTLEFGTVTIPAAGITEADQYRLSSGFTGSADPVTSNWERNDTNFALIGDGVGQASGVFTFPSTGIWKVDSKVVASKTSDAYYVWCFLKLTTDGTNYNIIAYGNSSINHASNTYYAEAHAGALINVTNNTDFKVTTNYSTDGATVAGNSGQMMSGITFLKLGTT